MTVMELLLEQERNDTRFWFTEEETQYLTKRSRTTLYKYRRDKILDFRKDGRSIRYIKASVYAYLRSRVEKEPVMVAAVTRPNSKPMVGRVG
jgi:Helix-turn-helix domain